MLRWLTHLPRRLLVGLVRGYQLIIGPHFQSGCRYTPSCSSYSIQALQKYGAVKGLILTVWRLLRCHPWAPSGYDPPRWFGEPMPEPLLPPEHDEHNHANEHAHTEDPAHA